ncbi:MAG: hypothetical protein JSW48_06125 [Betaproteobacteria bacterium]|nr:MAG: hypothetical protein JSW48_06125 [Betaproteobacteria bacterium]
MTSVKVRTFPAGKRFTCTSDQSSARGGRAVRTDIFEGVLVDANLIIAAWQGERLVGIVCSLAELEEVAYLAELEIGAAQQN